MEELKKKIKDLKIRVDNLITKANLDEKRRTLRELEAKSLKSDFWQDERKAQKVMREISEIDQELKSLEVVEKRVKETEELLEVISQESDARREIEEIEKEVGSQETKMFLSGEHDRDDVVLSIHSGQGGTEAMDWVAMLYRMYTRFFESRGWKTESVEENPGDEAGFKNVTLIIHGNFAYGFLKAESGVHRLVRLSPFNAQNLRQTSFALVEVLPLISEESQIEIKEDDLEWDFFRASGHGGQNVNKVSTAVRVRHKPTNIVVTSQAERQQARNRELALSVLKSKLTKIEEEEKKEKKEMLRGEHKIAGWGNQIRSYVLHPYKMVKDLRTGCETSKAEEVLDGQLEGFIEAEVQALAPKT